MQLDKKLRSASSVSRLFLWVFYTPLFVRKLLCFGLIFWPYLLLKEEDEGGEVLLSAATIFISLIVGGSFWLVLLLSLRNGDFGSFVAALELAQEFGIMTFAVLYWLLQGLVVPALFFLFTFETTSWLFESR